MAYVTYKKTQYSVYKKEREIPVWCTENNGESYKTIDWEGIRRYSKPPKKMPLILPKPDFMPNYLVRISDMKVVQGSEVHEGYCALSYSWNQSGEITKNEITGNKERIDQGKHRIIFPAKMVRKKPRGRKRIPRKVKFVTFERLIQEICKDFNIKYIWYDQMCIDQTNDEEKHGQISQMHHIYRNAYCTIALVPELGTDLCQYLYREFWRSNISYSSLIHSQWMKRMWTLEETIISSKMLFVGYDHHYWWYRLDKLMFPIFHELFHCDVTTALYYAHTRISTKEHDHVFAFANIFPEILKEIKIDYKQDIHELMIQFYGILAKKDISILTFRGKTADNYEPTYETPSSDNPKNSSTTKAECEGTIQKFDLPTWTGVYGEHDKSGSYKTSFKNYTVSGRVLQLTCKGLTNNEHYTEISAHASITFEDIPSFPQKGMNFDSLWTLIVRVQFQGSTCEKCISIMPSVAGESEVTQNVEYIIQKLQELSHFMPINKKKLQWIKTRLDIATPNIFFDGLTETLDNFSQYVLLTEVRFTGLYDNHPYYPIIKKNGDYYKAIGICSTFGVDDLLNDMASEKQMFAIL
ncbi:hypothetical protein INT45_009833 [Circinella minor]|uniref:Heterokaryon incompatibility domain-containing protein n=1 Tax=Circinella minor TaxID=1195481 RepID=A0A8H7S545_9FUNG|nr:hypothetical protein INT45_009833 [Circinella minor]